MTLTVAGGISIDLIENPPQLHGPLLGGSAVYAAMAAATLTDVRIVSAVGDDLSPAAFDPLKAAGVDVSDVVTLPGLTATWRGSYGTSVDRRRTTRATQGVAASFRPRLSAAALASPAVLIGAGDPAQQLAIREQVSPQALVGVDTIDHWIEDDPEGVRAVLATADVVFIGWAEARQLTGFSEATAIASALALKPGRALVLKDGEQGSWLLLDGPVEHVPVFPVPAVIDPTGAGDVYAGAFMAFAGRTPGPLSGARLFEAMLWGAAAGSIVVEGYGVAPLLELDRRRIEERVVAIAAGGVRAR